VGLDHCHLRALRCLRISVRTDRGAARCRTAAFYVANWNFVDKGQDYFTDSLESSPFLDLWSTAVEEQFYLVLPLVMLGLLAPWVRSEEAARMITIADYGTDTRAYQLLTGSGRLRSHHTERGVTSANTAGGLVTVGVRAPLASHCSPPSVR
jgi:peptidoglycan/LPS O-acetylase OafA/YrhL